MAQTVTKRLLSGSTNGKKVLITATVASGATTIHTAATGTGTIDEVWTYAQNLATTESLLQLTWGATGVSTATGGDRITMRLPIRQGAFLVTPGFPLNNAKPVKAFTTGQGRIAIHGYVHRIATG